MKQKNEKIVSLLQQKGGSGKTTTAINIACGLKELGYKVAVIDIDKISLMLTCGWLKIIDQVILSIVLMRKMCEKKLLSLSKA